MFNCSSHLRSGFPPSPQSVSAVWWRGEECAGVCSYCPLCLPALTRQGEGCMTCTVYCVWTITKTDLFLSPAKQSYMSLWFNLISMNRKGNFDILVFFNCSLNPLVTRKGFSDRFCTNFQGYFKADDLEFHLKKQKNYFFIFNDMNFFKFLVNLMMYF